MLVSLRRFKMVLPPFPPHLMIRYQSRHLESTLNQFISFVFNHPPRFELSTMRRRRRRRHWGRGERGRTKEITEESIVEIFFLQWRSLASPSSSLASWLNNPTAFRHACSTRNYPLRLYSNYSRYFDDNQPRQSTDSWKRNGNMGSLLWITINVRIPLHISET